MSWMALESRTKQREMAKKSGDHRRRLPFDPAVWALFTQKWRPWLVTKCSIHKIPQFGPDHQLGVTFHHLKAMPFNIYLDLRSSFNCNRAHLHKRGEVRGHVTPSWLTQVHSAYPPLRLIGRADAAVRKMMAWRVAFTSSASSASSASSGADLMDSFNHLLLLSLSASMKDEWCWHRWRHWPLLLLLLLLLLLRRREWWETEEEEEQEEEEGLLNGSKAAAR